MDHTFWVEALPDSLGSRLSAFSNPSPVKNTLDVVYLLIVLYIAFNLASQQKLSQGEVVPQPSPGTSLQRALYTQ